MKPGISGQVPGFEFRVFRFQVWGVQTNPCPEQSRVVKNIFLGFSEGMQMNPWFGGSGLGCRVPSFGFGSCTRKPCSKYIARLHPEREMNNLPDLLSAYQDLLSAWICTSKFNVCLRATLNALDGHKVHLNQEIWYKRATEMHSKCILKITQWY